jgi:uncharacterized membrane protein
MRGLAARRRLRVPALVRREPLLFALVGAMAVIYAVYAIWEHNHFQTDIDLAIADQAVWHYSRFEAPQITTIWPATWMLGDHFSPILVLLAPLYWVWADPRMLLAAQGLAIAASIVPVFLYARPRIGRVGAYGLAAAYASFWSISAAVGYNFHELAFSPLLVALCIFFADAKRWRPYFVSLALLLAVKENMSVVAFFLGLWLLTQREPRRAAITSAAGLVYYLVVVNLLIPLFNAGRKYGHWTYGSFGDDLPSALRTIADNPALLVHKLIDDPAKTRTVAYLVVPFLGLILWSPLLIVAVPMVLQQLLSDSSLFWSRDFHYWLTIAPILAMGAADGLRNLLRVSDVERWAPWVGAVAAAVMLYANVEIAKRFPLWRMTQPDFSLAASPPERQREQALAAVPDDASLITQVSLLPHVSERDKVYLLGNPAPTPEYVVYDPAHLAWPSPEYAQRWLDHRRSRYRQVLAAGDLVVLRLRRSP